MSKRTLVTCERCGNAYFKDDKGKGSSKNLCAKCTKLVKKIKLEGYGYLKDQP